MAQMTERNLAAEQRAVEGGHRALQGDRADRFRVVSDTVRGKVFHVVVAALQADEPIVFHCEPDGENCFADDHLVTRSDRPGHTPCKHAALVARRLEREGAARWEGGIWLTTGTFPFPEHLPVVEDPFDGLGF